MVFNRKACVSQDLKEVRGRAKCIFCRRKMFSAAAPRQDWTCHVAEGQ